MKMQTNHCVQECNVLIESVGFALGAPNEVQEIGDITGLFAPVVYFSLDARDVGQLVRLSLTDICCAHANRTMEWPKDKMSITAKRTTNGVEVAIEERFVESRGAHTLSSFNIRGVERITIQCEFEGDRAGKHIIVIIVIDPSQGRRGVGGAGGGGSGCGGGGGSGGGGAGGSNASRRDGGSSSRTKSSRYEEGGSGQKRAVHPMDDGPGYSRRTLDQGVGPNCAQARPDHREMVELLAAQAASEQEVSLRDISHQQCPKCYENEQKHTCCVCQEQPIRILFQPCMHLVCCEKCGNNEQLVKCPICRGTIEKRSVVYGSGV